MADLAGVALTETTKRAGPERALSVSEAAQSVVDPCAPRPFQDLPVWVWRAFFASWALLCLTLVLNFALGVGVWFVFGVIAVFAAVFFCAPLALLRLTRRGKASECGQYVDLLYGRSTNIEAAIQIVLLPIVLSLGLIAISAAIPD